MIHDFAEFTDGTPCAILNQLEAVFAEPIQRMRVIPDASKESDRPRLIL